MNALGVAWALRQCVKSPEEKLIVMLLGAHSTGMGCDMTDEQIAEASGYSIHIVRSVMIEIEARKII